MGHSKTIGIGSAVLFTALWAFPLGRAISFFRDAKSYFQETSSLDAATDLWYSKCLLESYVLSLSCVLALCLFVFSRPRPVFLLPFFLVAFSVIDLIAIHPEEPILLGILMPPWLPAYISVASFAVGALFHFGGIFLERLTNGH
jgi:hypothetical protein